MTSHLPAFVGVSVLLALAPGPDFALVTRNALAHGRRGALLTCAGLALGVGWWVVASTFGLSVLLQASASAYRALRLAGAVYLGYLGLRTLVESFGRGPSVDGAPGASPRGAALVRQGALSAGLNPKLGVFFVTFLPQFTDAGSPLGPQILLLGTVFGLIGLLWMTGYGLAVSRLRAIVTRRAVRRGLERVSGCVLLAFALRLAVDRG